MRRLELKSVRLALAEPIRMRALDLVLIALLVRFRLRWQQGQRKVPLLVHCVPQVSIKDSLVRLRALAVQEIQFQLKVQKSVKLVPVEQIIIMDIRHASDV
jgi:hypothetical protein